MRLVAGVDEAGCGPLAGPVTAAAVVFDPEARRVNGLRDSKTLTRPRRELLAKRVQGRALAWAVAWADPAEIDALNILEARLLAMRRALRGLGLMPDHVEMDGNRGRLPRDWTCTLECVVGGDGCRRSISAASILAKVHRDSAMAELHRQYPQYGFDVHKGYPTRVHLDALRRHGPSPAHRFSFAPVRAAATR